MAPENDIPIDHVDTTMALCWPIMGYDRSAKRTVRREMGYQGIRGEKVGYTQ